MRTRRLDIQMQQVAGSGVFVAVGRLLRLQVADAVQLQTTQYTAHRRRAQTELARDPDPGPTLPPEPFDLHHSLLGRASRRAVWTRTAVPQTLPALLAITPDPPGCTLPAEPALGCRLAQAQQTVYYASCKPLSTVNR